MRTGADSCVETLCSIMWQRDISTFRKLLILTVTHRQNLLECNWIRPRRSRIVSFGIKVHLLYEPGYVIPCIANLTEEKSHVNTAERRLFELISDKCGQDNRKFE
jgi:hypothetical protein